MSAVPIVTKQGPRTYTPADNSVILGGQLVEGSTGGRIVVATAGSLRVLGAATNDAVAPEDFPPADATDALGRSVVSFVPVATSTAVVYGGMETIVTYAADAAFGQKLIAAANGTVTPAGATPDARTLVGTCTEPGGVVVATKATGLYRAI